MDTVSRPPPSAAFAKADGDASDRVAEPIEAEAQSAGSEATKPGAPGSQHPPVGGETSSGDARSGSIGTITGPGILKSAGDPHGAEHEASHSSSATRPMPIELSMTTTSSAHSAPSMGAEKQDTGELVAGTTFSQVGGRPVSPFGAESFEPAFSGTTWTLAGGVCKINTILDINCPWGTASGGCTDVPSGTAGMITKANWQDVRDDLTPGTSSPFKSRRSKFYSQGLVERHEKFHGTDDEGWVKSSGLALAQAKAKTATINSPTAGADVARALTTCLSMLRSENLKWYKGGGSAHDSYAGEIRAYADGKAEYDKLAKAVETHGKTL
jgi:hypothetical protein